jgi:FixJ family two-component response regulator
VTRICIVDDHESFGKSLKRLLAVRGHEVEYFSSPRVFLKAAVAGKIQGMAIIDVYMPELDGFSLMDSMRTMDIDLRVIMISGHDDPDAERIAMQHGAIGFLRKPIDEELLLAMIHAQDSRNSR